MITDEIRNIGRYRGLHPNLDRAIDWLASVNAQDLLPGDHPIDGKNAFANVADNLLQPKKPAFEAHDRYADIQAILSGEERFCCA